MALILTIKVALVSNLISDINIMVNSFYSLRLWFPLRLALDHERFVILVRPRLHLEQNLGGGRLLDDEGRTLN